MTISISTPIPVNSSSVSYLKNIGDKVEKGDVVAEVFRADEQIEIDIAGILAVSPKEASNFLIKNIGDDVETDEIIAKREKGIVFKKQLKVTSLIKGKIFELDNFSGRVKIKGVQEKKQLKSPVNGVIKDETNEKFSVEFKGSEVELKKAVGQSFFAPVLKISGADEEVEAGQIEKEINGKILLGGHFSLSDLNKAMACGVKAVIGCRIKDDVLTKINAGKEFEIAGAVQKMSLSIGVVEAQEFDKIEKHVGREIYFDGENKRIILPEK